MSETETIERMAKSVDDLKEAFKVLANMMGARLTRSQMCQRLGVHRNTLKSWELEGKIPTPGADGCWLLSEVVEWESCKPN